MDDIITINLLDAAGLSGASEEEKQEFFKKAASIVLARLIERIENQLVQDKREEFFSVFSENRSDEERLSFLRAHVPNFEQLFIDEALAFKKEALDVAKSQ